MEHVFKTPQISTIIFTILIIVYLVAPVVTAPFFFKEVKWKILGTLITYAGVSPFIIIFTILLVNTSSIAITINPDYIIYTIQKETITLRTGDAEYFVFDYIKTGNSADGTQFYKVFELGGGKQKVRFTYKLTSRELQELAHEQVTKANFKKSLQFKSYGLSLFKKECLQLTGLIEKYTGLKPALKTGFFNEE